MGREVFQLTNKEARIKFKCHHFALPKELKYLGIEHQWPLCSSSWINIVPLWNYLAKKFKPESDQALGFNNQLGGNTTEEGDMLIKTQKFNQEHPNYRILYRTNTLVSSEITYKRQRNKRQREDFYFKRDLKDITMSNQKKLLCVDIVPKLIQTNHTKLWNLWDNWNFEHFGYLILLRDCQLFLGVITILWYFFAESLSFRGTLSNIISEIMISRVYFKII